MRRRGGFSLVEVVVALVILMVGVLALQAVTTRFLQVVSSSDRRAFAAQLAEGRVAEIQLDPTYDGLTARYEGVDSAAAFDGLVRTTSFTLTRDSTEAGITEYRTITVTVTGPGLREPVSRTTVVGAP